MMYRLRYPFAFLLTLVLSVPILAAHARQDTAEATLNGLMEKYDVTLIVTQPSFPVRTNYGMIEGREAARQDIDSYVPLFASEFSRYPVELVQKSKLRRIILCAGLAFAGQPRTGIPDFGHNDLYIDVGRGRHDELYTRKVIHHEFFHIIDYRDDGSLYTDERWSALNPIGFNYGTGGKNAQNDSTMSILSASYAGFLNKYSMSAVEEDKAELFAHMMVLPRVVEMRAKTDRVIFAKVQRMRELVRQFCSKADDEFWDPTLRAVAVK